MRKLRTRRARREQLKAEGIKPVHRQEVCCIVAERTELLPAWLKRHVIAGIKTRPNEFWLHRPAAMGLVMFFRTISVRYQLIKSEYKRCELCYRPTVGLEAEALRRQMESSPQGRSLPCGPSCARDQKTGIWRNMMEVAA